MKNTTRAVQCKNALLGTMVYQMNLLVATFRVDLVLDYITNRPGENI